MSEIRVTPVGMIGNISCGMAPLFFAFSSAGKFLKKANKGVYIIFLVKNKQLFPRQP